MDGKKGGPLSQSLLRSWDTLCISRKYGQIWSINTIPSLHPFVASPFRPSLFPSLMKRDQNKNTESSVPGSTLLTIPHPPSHLPREMNPESPYLTKFASQ